MSNPVKTIFKNKHSRIWLIVTIAVVAILIVANILANYFSGIISIALGRDRAIPVETSENAMKYYEVSTKSKDEANENAFALTEELSQEGTILLKNDGALPLKENAKVSVFGKNSVNLVYGGIGSGGGDSTFNKKNIFESLTAAGFSYNETLKKFYEDNSKSGSVRGEGPSNMNPDAPAIESIATGETPQSNYNAHNISSSYSGYKDAAIVVFSRIGGEGFDLPTGAAFGAKHYLDLDTNEKELLTHVTNAGFTKVIVILNTLNIVEAGFLNQYNGKIDGALWIGGPGTNGIMALGKILNGSVTPSGRTVSTWPADFTKDPTWHNFAERNTEHGNQYFNTTTNKNESYYFVNYEENVYVGYRYYETRGITQGPEWYKDNVIFPFGYGLSYTTFDWDLTNKSSIENIDISKDGKYEVKVKVTNTGAYKGKDVVQMYVKLHYNNGGLEKPYVILASFAKTSMLYPTAAKAAHQADASGTGKPNSEEVILTFNPYDIASYDYLGKSGFKGWVIEAGSYALHINTDSNKNKFSIPFNVSKNITYRNDPVSGNEVINRYTDQENGAFNSDTRIKESLMSRANFEGTFPDAPKETDRYVDSTFISQLADVSHNNPNVNSYSEMPKQGLAPKMDLAELLIQGGDSVNRNRWFASYDNQDANWEAVLNALTVNEMALLFNDGGFKTINIQSINKPETLESDGPVGWCNFIAKDEMWKGNNAYTSQVVISATWNNELAKKMGECVGEEALWGAAKSDGRTYSGWYAPGVNIHRSPFGGRNFEYYSEDSFLTGMIASAVIRGCSEKGVYTYVKHFALNEQETKRGGLVTWATEQTMREIYLKPFEMAVKVGQTTGIMSAFNRIGTRWTGGDYRLLTDILRDEWNFRGTVICDYNTGASYMNTKQMIYAGGDLNLATAQNAYWNNYDSRSAADVTVLRRAAKNVLYTVVNSNAMNNLNYRYEMAVWKIILIVIDCVIPVFLAIWGFFVIRKVIKKAKQVN